MLFALNGRCHPAFLRSPEFRFHFFLFVDRVNLAAAAQVIQKDPGLSNIALGIAFSGASTSSICAVPDGRGLVCRPLGARRTLSVCGLAWSITQSSPAR